MTDTPLIESVSLFLTPLVYLSLLLVLSHYGPALKREVGTHYWWLIFGIVLLMSFKVVDNFFWNIPWSARYFHSISEAFWFSIGPYSNVPFRQVAIILGCSCHLIASYRSGKQFKSLHVFWCCFASLALWFTAIFIATH